MRDPFFSREMRMMDDSFDRIEKMMMPVLRSTYPAARAGTLLKASPGYEIKESEGSYEIALDIPEGLETKDLKVELERDGTVVHVSGKRHFEKDGVESSMQFSKRFTIGMNIDKDNIQANFADGCLVIRAPKLVTEEEGNRQIPITSQPHQIPSEEEVRQKDYSDEFDESDWAETGKKAA